MNIKSLNIKNFRNYAIASVSLCDGINLVLGDNAQGKTSLLEAIYLCSVGKSARASKDKELIKIDADKAQIQLQVQSGEYLDKVSITIERTTKKTVSINNMPILRIGELMGVCKCVLFSPDEMNIIKDGPSERRRFVDIALCQMSKSYFYTLQIYNKVLAQRNKLLKSGNISEDDLIIWDIQLANVGCKIAKNRYGFVQKLANFAKNKHSILSDEKETLVVGYEGLTAETDEELKQKFLKNLVDDRIRDLKHGYTHSGVHKDDISLFINNIDVRIYGSQGQQRTTILSLKLAQIDLIQDMYNQKPILLLDDVLSELDTNRCKKLLQFCSQCQTILTATHIEDELMSTLDSPNVFCVNKGEISQP